MSKPLPDPNEWLLYLVTFQGKTAYVTVRDGMLLGDALRKLFGDETKIKGLGAELIAGGAKTERIYVFR